MTCLHDPNWLGEAFYNILDNAVKYSEYKGLIKVEMCIRDSLVVTPFAGVWIEMYSQSSLAPCVSVTPFAGVWIEISYSGHSAQYSYVTPFAGVWIEM